MKNISVRRSRSVALLTAGALITGVLFGTTVAQAGVQREGELATGITDLTIGSKTYDVEFTCNTSTFLPWDNPPVFDFTDGPSARNATDAIVASFNGEGGILAVGCGSGAGEYSPLIFRLAFRREEVSIPLPDFWPFNGREINVDVLFTWEGITGDTSSPGVWAVSSPPGEENDFFPWGDDSVVPVFTEVGSGGAGNSPPVAVVGGPYEGGVGNAVNFDGSGSSDSDGDIVTYSWIFSDGGTGTGETTSHTYAAADTYNVTLTVTDDAGSNKSDTTTAVIGAGSSPPVADAGGPQYYGTVLAPVSFDGTDSYDPDGNITSYSWQFGDGGTANGATPKHTYTASGQYDVILTVTDNSGETDSDWADARTGQGNRPPVADAGGPYNGAAGVANEFDGSNSSDPEGGNLTYEWKFGDGSAPATGRQPSHTYDTAGSYFVQLTVADEFVYYDSDSTSAIIGDGQPDPDDRKIDLVTLGNVGGSNAADLAVLDVALVNGDSVSATIHVRDGGTGNEIYQVGLTDSWRSLALETVVGNSGPLLAILQRNSDGRIRVQILNASDGTSTFATQYFDDSWTPIDLLAVSDAGGLSVAGIGVLAENPAGQQAIEVRTVGDGALVERVLYFNDVWQASHALDLGDFNGNGRSEMAVLATNSTGKHAVETRDALSGKQISRYFFLGPTNTLIGLAGSADVDGNGKPELIVLGNKDAANSTANTAQTKDVKTGVLISKPGSFAPPFVGFALRSMGDVDGNSSPEMVIGAFDDEGNVTRVQVRDVATGTLTLNTGILSAAYAPQDLEVMDDVSGNAIEELVAAGVDASDLGIRVQLRDGQDGSVLLNIDID